MLDQHPEFKAKINDPIGAFDSPAITNVRTREMLEFITRRLGVPFRSGGALTAATLLPAASWWSRLSSRLRRWLPPNGWPGAPACAFTESSVIAVEVEKQLGEFSISARFEAASGVTAVFEMPNTNPTTTSSAALADKIASARHRMHCDFAFFIGGTRENVPDLPELERAPGCAGVKVFIGSSTGALLVEDDESLRRIFKVIRRRAAFHAEDEYRLNERKPLRIEGDTRSHPVWRDEPAALQPPGQGDRPGQRHAETDGDRLARLGAPR